MRRALFAVVAAAIAIVGWRSIAVSAHVTVISKYTFGEHVLPILRDRCGACHGEGGSAFPLLQYDAAKRQRWQIQQSLLSGRMPPWSADPGATPFKGSQSLSLRELDVLMTWAAGGTPEGPPIARTTPAPSPTWTLGTPDAILLSAPYTLDATRSEAIHETVLPGDAARGRSIRGVDLLPGAPSIVRRAEMVIKHGDGERTIGLWVPGDTPQLLGGDAAYALPQGASLVIRIHYARPQDQTEAAVLDRSQVGLYLASRAGVQNPRSLEIGAAGEGVSRTMRVLALRPISGPAGAAVSLVVVAPDGSRKPLTRIRLRQRWPRRYVLAKPVVIAAGSRIEVRVTTFDERLWAPMVGDEPKQENDGPLRIALEIID